MALLGLLFLMAAAASFWVSGLLHGQGRKRFDVWGIAAAGGGLVAQAVLALGDSAAPLLFVRAGVLVLSVLFLALHPCAPQLRERCRDLGKVGVRRR